MIGMLKVNTMDAYRPALEEMMEKGIHCLEAEPLKLHTTFGIGGPADVFCVPAGRQQLAEVIDICHRHQQRYYLLGCGSNVLFGDKGYRGVVIYIGRALGGIEVEDNRLVAGAGVDLSALCIMARDCQLAGLEFAYGIPGSVGGAVYMDAGAYGGEVCQVLHHVDFLDENLQVRSLPVKALEMGYRYSIFHSREWCILSATFQLSHGDGEAIGRAMDDYMGQRRSKQPLEKPSAGSAFKRPEGAFAAALIDQSGLRGYRIGDAAISEKHCGFIVNLGQASCCDVLRLPIMYQKRYGLKPDIFWKRKSGWLKRAKNELFSTG